MITTLLGADEPPTPEPNAQSSKSGLFAWYAQGFSDLLGDRLLLFDNTEQGALELLRFHARLFDVPQFERALREQTRDLTNFDNPSFARAWRVERLPEPGGGIALVSTHPPGTRLSEVLASASRRRTVLDTAAALLVIKQLVTAMAMLQQRGRHVYHGAINLDRLVISPDGRVTVPEYVIGPALATLSWDAERFWKDLRLPLPGGRGAVRFDQRTDVVQTGVVALSLILNRPLKADEYPRALPELVDRAVSATYGDPALRAGLESWLSRALQLHHEPFTSAVQAWTAFDEILAHLRLPVSAQLALRTFLGTFGTSASTTPRPVASTTALDVSGGVATAVSRALHAPFGGRRLLAAAAPEVAVVQREIRFWKAAVIVLAAISLGEAWFIGTQLTTPSQVETLVLAQPMPAPAEASALPSPVTDRPRPARTPEQVVDEVSQGTTPHTPAAPARRPVRVPSSRSTVVAPSMGTIGLQSAATGSSGLAPSAPPLSSVGERDAVVAQTPTVEISIGDKLEIRRALSQYESAYNASDSSTIQEVWPSAEPAGPGGADQEGRQQIEIGTCVYEAGADSVAARCRGSAAMASFDSGMVRTEYRTFIFKLRKVGERWTIVSADAER